MCRRRAAHHMDTAPRGNATADASCNKCAPTAARRLPHSATPSRTHVRLHEQSWYMRSGAQRCAHPCSHASFFNKCARARARRRQPLRATEPHNEGPHEDVTPTSACAPACNWKRGGVGMPAQTIACRGLARSLGAGQPREGAGTGQAVGHHPTPLRIRRTRHVHILMVHIGRVPSTWR